MKIVIESGATKREINGSFSICASRGDLQEIAKQLAVKLNEPDWSYGWMTVFEPLTVYPNRKAIPWDAPSGAGLQLAGDAK